MPTSKANTNTVTKIALDAIPPSFHSSALFCFPTQNSAYNPAEIRVTPPKLSRDDIDALIPDDHETFWDHSKKEALELEKICAQIIRARFGKTLE